MLRKRLMAVLFVCVGLAFIGCAIFGTKSAKENESEIVINFGATVRDGRFAVSLNGESWKSVRNRGGTVKYIVPNGMHVIMVLWEESYGTTPEMASMQVWAYSSKTILFVTKPFSGEPVEIIEAGVADLPPDHHD